VATNVEVYERIHLHLGYVCVSKSTMPSAIWFITIIPNPWKSIVIYFYGPHHKFPMFQILLESIFLWLIGWQKWHILSQPLKQWQVKVLIKLFFNNIYNYHDFPLDIVSDCGSQFIHVLERIVQVLKIQISFSLANHPHTNGQIEGWIRYWNNTFDVQSIYH